MRIGMELDLNRIEPPFKNKQKMLEHLRAHLTPTTPQKKVKRFFFRFFRFSFSDLHFFKIKITLDFCENSKFDFFFGQHQKNKSMFFFVFFFGKSGYQSLRWFGRPRVGSLLISPF